MNGPRNGFQHDEITDRAQRPPGHRKTRDRALILPLVGLIALLPPVAGIFRIDMRVLGVPFTAAYLFIVWAALIAGAAMLSRRLRDGTYPSEDPERDTPASR